MNLNRLFFKFNEMAKRIAKVKEPLFEFVNPKIKYKLKYHPSTQTNSNYV